MRRGAIGLADQDRDHEREDDAKTGENHRRPKPPPAFRLGDEPRRTYGYAHEGNPDQPVPHGQQGKCQCNDDDDEEREGQVHGSVSGATMNCIARATPAAPPTITASHPTI